MNMQQCAADRLCRGGGDGVDVGGRRMGRGEDMIAAVGYWKLRW